jgi:hypothetical protein
MVGLGMSRFRTLFIVENVKVELGLRIRKPVVP